MIAPSGHFDPEEFNAGLEWLRTRFEVRSEDSILDREGYLAGTDARRLHELRAALHDPDAAAIVCVRGGYGALRLLGELHPSEVRANPKPLIGFSDITALHACWARARVGSWHAPMVAALGRADDHAREAWNALITPTGCLGERLEVIRSGPESSGRLLGGNLATLVSLLGTPFFPSLDGAVLFLEEVGERVYRIDRTLSTLLASGALQNVRAVLLGQFTNCHSGADGVEVIDVLRERLANVSCPVLLGVDAGHGAPNQPLPFGATVRVQPERGLVNVLKSVGTA